MILMVSDYAFHMAKVRNVKMKSLEELEEESRLETQSTSRSSSLRSDGTIGFFANFVFLFNLFGENSYRICKKTFSREVEEIGVSMEKCSFGRIAGLISSSDETVSWFVAMLVVESSIVWWITPEKYYPIHGMLVKGNSRFQKFVKVLFRTFFCEPFAIFFKSAKKRFFGQSHFVVFVCDTQQVLP